MNRKNKPSKLKKSAPVAVTQPTSPSPATVPQRPQQLTTHQAYQLAEQYFKAGQFGDAEVLCRQLLEVEPKYANALHLLGVMAARAGLLNEAERLISQAIAINPTVQNYHDSLANIHQLKHQTDATKLSEKNAATNPTSYAHWIQLYDILTDSLQKKIQQHFKFWPSTPKISVLLVTHNSNETWLRAAIDSVLNQLYPHWELCITDDASTSSSIRHFLATVVNTETRIKVAGHLIHQGISASANQALALATGDYVILLDHHDQLAPHALFMVAKAVITHPETVLIYSDEDQINDRGERSSPYFKSSWNPDLFLSQNFIQHLVAYQISLLRKIGGFREGYEAAYDYDVNLRMIEKIDQTQIRHLPHVLYHRRLDDLSTTTATVNTVAIAQKIVAEHLARIGVNAQVNEAFNCPGALRVQYAIPGKKLPLVSLIIPTYNQFNLLRTCVESIRAKTNYPNFEIIIVDNRSDDPEVLHYLQKLEDQAVVRVIKYPHPFNYSAINNLAVTQAQGELIGLLNNDVEVINESWLTEMVGHAVRPEIGAVGARLWYGNNALQHGGVILGLGEIAEHAHKFLPRGNSGYFGRAQLLQNFSAVTGACLVMRKAVFNQVGGLNETHLPVTFNDVDLCLKIGKLGLRMIWTPYAELYHHESVSRGRDDSAEKQARFAAESAFMHKSWDKLLRNDPAYNPNLTLKKLDFSLAFPPRIRLENLFNQNWQPLTLPTAATYQSWYHLTRCQPPVLAAQRDLVQQWQDQPLISIIIPTFNSPVQWLDELLASLHQQSYPVWECLIVDDASPVKAHLDTINSWCKRDQRFRLIQCANNQGVAATSQVGVQEAKGLYVGIVDHDDLVEPNALFEIAKVIREEQPDVIYSDEMLILENGQTFRCELRPDFNYHFLLSHPYIVHLTVSRRELVLKVGGFDSHLQISQDYDLLLRLAAVTQRFYHLPKVLYQWRIHANSTGHAYQRKVVPNSLNALNQHLRLLGFNEQEAWAEEGLSFNFFRIRHKINPAKVSLIIPTRDRVELLQNCLESIEKKTRIPSGVELETLIVDNGSSEIATLQFLEKLRSRGYSVLSHPGVFNYSLLNNAAVQQASGTMLLFMNNDIEVIDAGWLEAMLELMAWQNVGVVGAKLIYPDNGLIQHAGVIIGFNGKAAHDHQFYPEFDEHQNWAPGHNYALSVIRECLAVTAACMLVRRSVFEEVKGFDPNLKVGFGDTDLCLKIRERGYKCLYTPYARLIHDESATRGYENNDHPQDTALFCQKWQTVIRQGDPFYNRNLTLQGKLFDPVFPGDLSAEELMNTPHDEPKGFKTCRVEILESTRHEPSPKELWGFSIDAPVVGPYQHDKGIGILAQPGTIQIAGWVLGRVAPVTAVQIVFFREDASREIIKTTVTYLHRPDVARHYPQVSEAEYSGFLMPLSIIGMPTEMKLGIQAVLQDGSCIQLGTIRLKHEEFSVANGQPMPVAMSTHTTIPVAQDLRLVKFRCNICGRDNQMPLEIVSNRETPSCKYCHSSLRMRSLMNVLSKELFGQSLILPQFPLAKHRIGIGMSDWEGYANLLSQKLAYTNTFYHAEPRLDITQIESAQEGQYDFIISSDVFEHIPPPVSIAFANTWRLLKPNGIFIFTVPYKKEGVTDEHFPELFEFRLEQRDGKQVLVNLTRSGVEQVFDNLVFHGGEGFTLEMRMFSESSLLEELKQAGFKEVKIYGENVPEWGIIWPINWALPIVARKK